MENDFLPGKGKEKYLDLIEIAVSAYTDRQITDYIAEVERDGLKEHGFPRLAANIGFLLAHGRGAKYEKFFVPLMDNCCAKMPGNIPAANNFTVKEVLLCILELEKSGRFPQEPLNRWKAQLATIVPETTYKQLTHNWNVFSAASEQTRIMAGLSDRADYVEKQIHDQLYRFDENGMFRDASMDNVPPQHPLVYDGVTRLQFAIALFNGYNGPSRAKLEKFMLKSAEATLQMQAVSGEIPYGGRSNGFLYNETYWAALCEFYAAWFKQRGDLATAGRFKASAQKALSALEYWLKFPDLRHIKNRFPLDSKFGCEGYGYFNKYMVTLGSWCCNAYLFADDTISPAATTRPAASVFVSSPEFHIVTLNTEDYTVQFDAPGDPHYDASGIGRIIRRGAPSFLALAYAFAVHPNYTLPADNPTPLALTPGAFTNTSWEYAYQKYQLRRAEAFPEKATCEASWDVTLPSGKMLVLSVTVTNQDVAVTLEGAGEISLAIPVFLSDGEKQAKVKAEDKAVVTAFAGWTCNWTTNGTVSTENTEYRNRNGVYRRYETRGKDKLELRCTLVKD